jgi:antiviral helicase SKI2
MLQEHVLTEPKYVKELTPGRMLLISHKQHINKLGILLILDTCKKERVFKVLVLCSDEKTKINGNGDEIQLSVASSDKEKSKEQYEHDPLWYKMLGLASKKKIFVPDEVGGHTVLTVTTNDIIGIVSYKVNVDFNLVFQDWEKRQIPRFR